MLASDSVLCTAIRQYDLKTVGTNFWMLDRKNPPTETIDRTARVLDVSSIFFLSELALIMIIN